MTGEQIMRLAQIANRPTEATLGEITSMATALLIADTYSKSVSEYTANHLKLEPFSKTKE